MRLLRQYLLPWITICLLVVFGWETIWLLQPIFSPIQAQSSQIEAKVDPTLLALLTVNQTLDSLQAKGEVEAVQKREKMLYQVYGTTDFQILPVLIRLEVDPTLTLRGTLSYAKAAEEAQVSDQVQQVLSQIADAGKVSVDTLHYLLYANAVLAEVSAEHLLDIATLPQVTWLGNGLTRLTPMDYNGPANYGLTSAGINSALLNQTGVAGSNPDGSGIKIGIIDSGAFHPDLNDGVVAFQDLFDMDITDNDMPSDWSGHGTHVTGIIHQVAPAADLYVGATDFSTAHVALGLEWLLQQDMAVINLSLGNRFLFSSAKDGGDELSYLVNQAVGGYYRDSGGQFQPTSARPIIVVSVGNLANVHDFGRLEAGHNLVRDLYMYDWQSLTPQVALYWHGDSNQTTFSMIAPNGSVFEGADLRTTDSTLPIAPYWNGALLIEQIDNLFYNQDRDYNLETWQLNITNNGTETIDYHLHLFSTNYAGFDLTALEEDMSSFLGIPVGLDPGTPRTEFEDNDKRFSTIAPGEAHRVITVGATEETGELATFSAQGPMLDGRIKPDVVAPGVDVWSTYTHFIDTSVVTIPINYTGLPVSFHANNYRTASGGLPIQIPPAGYTPYLAPLEGEYYVLLYDSLDDNIDEWNTLLLSKYTHFGNNAIGPAQLNQTIPFSHTPQPVTLDYIAPDGSFAQASTYLPQSGTSMAAPHIAGAAALLLDHFRNLGYNPSPAQIKALLMNSTLTPSQTVQTDKNARTGAGRPDVYRASLGDIFSGQGNYWDDFDTLTLQQPHVFPSEYLPAKSTLYWEEWDDQTYAFTLSASGQQLAGYDTTHFALADGTTGPTDVSITYNGQLGPTGAWVLATSSFPTAHQTVDGDIRRGFQQYLLNIPPGSQTYTVSLPPHQPEAVRAILAWPSPQTDLNLTLTTPSGITLPQSTLTGVAIEQIHSEPFPESGGWELHLQNRANQTISATLMVNYPILELQSAVYLPVLLKNHFTPQDTYEPNNTFSEAYPISAGITYTSYIWVISDVDWFRVGVNVPPGKERLVTANLTDLPAEVDYDLAIYKSDGQQLAVSSNPGHWDETVSVVANQNETYYLQVFPYQGSTPIHPYLLHVEIGAPHLPK